MLYFLDMYLSEILLIKSCFKSEEFICSIIFLTPNFKHSYGNNWEVLCWLVPLIYWKNSIIYSIIETIHYCEFFIFSFFSVFLLGFTISLKLSDILFDILICPKSSQRLSFEFFACKSSNRESHIKIALDRVICRNFRVFNKF
jgi:hypothetical protein